MLFSDSHRNGVLTRVTTNGQLTPNTDSHGYTYRRERCEKSHSFLSSRNDASSKIVLSYSHTQKADEYNQIAIVESPRCLEVRAIERFPIVAVGRARPGRIDMWCVSLVDDSDATSMNCRPGERLDRLDSDGHRQCAKTHHRSHTGLHFWFGSSVGRAEV